MTGDATSDHQIFQVIHEITREDFRYFNKFVRRRSIFGNPYIWTPLMIVFLIGMTLEFAGVWGTFIFRVFGMALLFGIATQMIFSRLTVSYSYARMEHLRGEHTTRINPEEIRVWSQFGEYSYFWNGVREVAEDKHNVYVLVGRHASIIVPKRAFDSVEDSEIFVEQARAFWQNSRSRWDGTAGA